MSPPDPEQPCPCWRPRSACPSSPRPGRSRSRRPCRARSTATPPTTSLPTAGSRSPIRPTTRSRSTSWPTCGSTVRCSPTPGSTTGSRSCTATGLPKRSSSSPGRRVDHAGPRRRRAAAQRLVRDDADHDQSTAASSSTAGAGSTAGPVRPLADRYGRAAAVTLAGQLYTLVGADGLQAVWRAAVGPGGRLPAGRPDRSGDCRPAGRPTGAGLLDLIAERTGVDASSLWSTWVVTPAEQPLLAARTSARPSSRRSPPGPDLDAPPGDPGRRSMPGSSTWRPSQLAGSARSSTSAIGSPARASAAGLVPRRPSRAAFEQGGTNAAAVEAANELQVISAITTAGSAQPDAPTPGPGRRPDRRDAGRWSSSAAGNRIRRRRPAAARGHALAADAAWSQADDAGSFRIRIGHGLDPGRRASCSAT